jgi:hypothetical protein
MHAGGAMRVHRHYLPALLVLALGCGSGTGPAAVEPDGVGPAPTGGGSTPTGLEGTAYSSPTRPVCQVDEPCTAPFSASFEVRQGERVVARFQSDSDGHFLVHLAPGTYTVVADASAGLLARSQVHEVTIGPSGLTHIELDFDTGIR